MRLGVYFSRLGSCDKDQDQMPATTKQRLDFSQAGGVDFFGPALDVGFRFLGGVTAY